MLETPGNDAGTCHAIALKPRENYCNLERLHNRNQPFLMVYRNLISLHLNYVVQWLCKFMLNCSPMIDYQLVRWYILLSDAKLTEDASQDFVGGDFTEDGTQFADGGAEVFGEEVSGGACVKAGAD